MSFLPPSGYSIHVRLELTLEGALLIHGSQQGRLEHTLAV